MTMKAFGCKLDEELIIQVKMHAMLTRTLMRDVVTRALVEYLNNHTEGAGCTISRETSREQYYKKVK